MQPSPDQTSTCHALSIRAVAIPAEPIPASHSKEHCFQCPIDCMQSTPSRSDPDQTPLHLAEPYTALHSKDDYL
jgi:aldehyde:ferredoxin oxidoreductase